MSATDTMKWMGRSARNRAQAVSHSMKDRALEKRLDRVSEEADRLQFENDLLRDEVTETRSEHHRILDMLEARLSEPEAETQTGKRSHRGRWLLFVLTLGGGAFAWVRMRTQGGHRDEWVELHDDPVVTKTGTATI
jgi:hypothetical protein